MKKQLSLLMSLLLALMALLPAALAEAPEPLTVYVSISDDTGALVLAYAPVTVTDTDADGALTLSDALHCAHAAHPEGAAAYQAVPSEFGVSLTRLWGIENGGSYGYYRNDGFSSNLLDPIAAGDHVKAYAFTDLAAWSDTYSFFVAPALAAKPGEPVELILSMAAFDESYAPVTLPAAGATLLVDGAATEAVTDENGQAILTFAEPGTYQVSAASEMVNLVPPVCIITVAE